MHWGEENWRNNEANRGELTTYGGMPTNRFKGPFFRTGRLSRQFWKAYAAFLACWALTLAHLALAAAAILFRPSAEILRDPEFEGLLLVWSDWFLNFAHLALWA